MKILSKQMLAGIGLVLASTVAGRADGPSVAWQELAPVPANRAAWNDAIPVNEAYWRQIGLAGPVAGVHADHLLVGGGANFPEPGKMPNEPNVLGKIYWNELFVMDLKTGTWNGKSFALPQAIGYAATVSLPEGVLVIGGEGFDGGPNGAKLAKLQKFATVSLLKYDAARNEIAQEAYPALPAASSYGAAALIGRSVYYQTGSDSFVLDLDKRAAGWSKLPAMPGAPRDTALAAAVGGRFVVASGRTLKDGVWSIHKDAYAFDPAAQNWTRLPDMPFPAMAGEAFGIGGRYMLVVAGDKDVERWNLLVGLETERARHDPGTPPWTRANTALTFLADHHLGFNTETLVYDAEANAWSVAGRFPGASPVTTQPVSWNGKLLLASGEIRPGIRSPKVWLGTVAP